MAAPEKGVVFLQLFSAPNCPFCPQAERNFSDLLADPDVIGFTCVVDYFNTGAESPLSKKFCVGEQDLYIRKLGTGARYTPQMVLNGKLHIPGYQLESTAEEIRRNKTTGMPVRPLDIRPGAQEKTYDIILPALQSKPATPEGAVTPATAEKYVLRIFSVIRKVDPATLARTGSARDHSPINVAVDVSEEGLWDGYRTVWSARPSTENGADAFIVMVQDRDSGEILAAGMHAFSVDAPGTAVSR